jgi:AcrR family transcriptional regulator
VVTNLLDPMSAPDSTRTRKSAEERREEIVALAIEQFALGGYRGTSTEAIARQAGISQPYLFRLFKTKRELFLACVELCDQRVIETFREAARDVPREEALPAMGKAYVEMLRDRTALLFQMQSYAACSDPVIQDRVRAGYGEIVSEVTRHSGARPEQVWQFFANGMLLNVVASLDLAATADRDEWARAWSTPLELIRLNRR